MQASSLSPGMGVKMDGRLFVVTGIEHRTPGNLRAFVQLTIKDVLKAQTLEKRLKPQDDIEVIDLESLEKLGQDVSTETMQKVAATFRSMADNPQFIVTENL